MTRDIIYEPRGAAGEYADRAANLAVHCTNGCVYCYVPGQFRKAREVFHDPANCKPRRNILRTLRQEANRHRGKEVFLCFTTDPCLPQLVETTIAAIDILNRAGASVNVLTKCDASPVLPYLAASARNRFGATLTLIDETARRIWEPRAATFNQRLASLMAADSLGLQTWASLEPVIDPAQSLEIIRRIYPYVDEIQVGKMNHGHTLPPKLQDAIKKINWPRFHDDAVALLDSLGCKYSIKNDLREAAGR